MNMATSAVLSEVISGAISALQAVLNQQQEAMRATDELLKRFTAKQAAGQPWTEEDVDAYFKFLDDRDNAVAKGGV